MDYGLNVPDCSEEIELNRYLLSLFNHSLQIIAPKNNVELHSIISDIINKGQLVGIYFDEYYVFYSKYYIRTHTSHCTIINEYDSDREVYSIIDHGHISKTSKLINYGNFFSTYNMVENIYSNLEPKDRIIFTVEKEVTDNQQLMKGLHSQLKQIINYLNDSCQLGGDTDTIYKNMRENTSCFDINSINKLYIQLGGKELVIDTLINYIFKDSEYKNTIKSLGEKIINDSNTLIKRYISQMYSEDSKNKILNSIEVIRGDTLEFFRAVLKGF